MSLKVLILGFGLLGIVHQLVGYGKSIFSEGSGKNGSTVAVSSQRESQLAVHVTLAHRYFSKLHTFMCT